MPQGSKSSYSAKQKRQAKHIEGSSRKKGRSAKASKRIAWATVNKKTGGAKKSASSSSAPSRSSPKNSANTPYRRRRRSNAESAYTH